MNRSLITTLVLLGCASLPLPLRAADQKARPNVLVIVADDLGYGDLGCYGGKEIPTTHIDALAQQGLKLTSGYVSGPYCSPTRAGLMTGRYQQRFGHEFNPGPITDDKFGLSLKEKTLPERLKAAGYHTAMVGKWHLGFTDQFHPLNRGFEQYFGFLGGAHAYFPAKNAQPILRGKEPVDEQEYLTDAFRREAVAYLKQPHDKPFFLYLTFNAVHNPQHAPKDLLEKFQSISNPRRRTYAGMLASMDNAIGEVLKTLKDQTLEDNTLVFFVSDNGGPEANGSTNTPLRGQKATTWEGGVRVPYLIRWPGKIPAGKTYDQPAIQLDFVPTILAAAGVDPGAEAALDGVNLLPYLTGEKSGAPHENLYWRFGEQMALRQGDWKIIKARGEDKVALYNLKDDISESKDLSGEHPEIAKRLQDAYDAWNKTLVSPTWIPAQQQQQRAANRARNAQRRQNRESQQEKKAAEQK